MATLLATYLPHRTTVASSRKAFIFALMDYDNTLSKLLNETKEYIIWALLLQGVVGSVVIFILFSIPQASPTFLVYAIMWVIAALMIGRVSVPKIIFLMIKLKGSEPKGSIESAVHGIINDARAAVFTAVLASLLMLPKLVSAKLPWQIDLMIIIMLLVGLLIVTYIPTIFDYLKYYDDERLPWDLELVNRWLSVPVRGGDSANGSPFAALSLDNGQKLEGRLVRVKKWGMILEDTSKRAKLYIRWERIAAVELMID